MLLKVISLQTLTFIHMENVFTKCGMANENIPTLKHFAWLASFGGLVKKKHFPFLNKLRRKLFSNFFVISVMFLFLEDSSV